MYLGICINIVACHYFCLIGKVYTLHAGINNQHCDNYAYEISIKYKCHKPSE